MISSGKSHDFTCEISTFCRCKSGMNYVVFEHFTYEDISHSISHGFSRDHMIFHVNQCGFGTLHMWLYFTWSFTCGFKCSLVYIFHLRFHRWWCPAYNNLSQNSCSVFNLHIWHTWLYCACLFQWRWGRLIITARTMETMCWMLLIPFHLFCSSH